VIASRSHSSRFPVLAARTGARNAGVLPATPVDGAPTPIKKWEFTTMKSIAQDCSKPGSLNYENFNAQM